MRSRVRDCLVVVTLLLSGALAFAQGGPIRYVYDELGRLVGVIDGNGDAAAYHYDAVGNLLSITRSTSSQVAIIEFSPTPDPSVKRSRCTARDSARPRA